MGITNCEITFFTTLKPKEENLQGLKLRTKILKEHTDAKGQVL